jgi:hypothetical protein
MKKICILLTSLFLLSCSGNSSSSLTSSLSDDSIISSSSLSSTNSSTNSSPIELEYWPYAEINGIIEKDITLPNFDNFIRYEILDIQESFIALDSILSDDAGVITKFTNDLIALNLTLVESYVNGDGVLMNHYENTDYFIIFGNYGLIEEYYDIYVIVGKFNVTSSYFNKELYESILGIELPNIPVVIGASKYVIYDYEELRYLYLEIYTSNQSAPVEFTNALLNQGYTYEFDVVIRDYVYVNPTRLFYIYTSDYYMQVNGSFDIIFVVGDTQELVTEWEYEYYQEILGITISDLPILEGAMHYQIYNWEMSNFVWIEVIITTPTYPNRFTNAIIEQGYTPYESEIGLVYISPNNTYYMYLEDLFTYDSSFNLMIYVGTPDAPTINWPQEDILNKANIDVSDLPVFPGIVRLNIIGWSGTTYIMTAQTTLSNAGELWEEALLEANYTISFDPLLYGKVYVSPDQTYYVAVSHNWVSDPYNIYIVPGQVYNYPQEWPNQELSDYYGISINFPNLNGAKGYVTEQYPTYHEYNIEVKGDGIDLYVQFLAYLTGNGYTQGYDNDYLGKVYFDSTNTIMLYLYITTSYTLGVRISLISSYNPGIPPTTLTSFPTQLQNQLQTFLNTTVIFPLLPGATSITYYDQSRLNISFDIFGGGPTSELVYAQLLLDIGFTVVYKSNGLITYVSPDNKFYVELIFFAEWDDLFVVCTLGYPS